MRATRTARDPRFVAAAVMIVVCALISVMNLGADSTSAATGPLGVRGYVWDQDWNPIPDANVTVKSWNGAVLIDTQYYDATEDNGYYTVTFGNSYWDIGYTIEITARYASSDPAVNSTDAPNDYLTPWVWLNASLEYSIPEFGSSMTAGLTIAGFAIMVVIMMSRRRRNG